MIAKFLTTKKQKYENEIKIKTTNKIGKKILGAEKIVLDEYSDVLSVQDLREILNVGRNAAYELLGQGEIPAFRIGRNWKIPKESVMDYLGKWRSK